jgi:hypothetical protein
MAFLIFSVIVFTTVALWVPKKLPKPELYAIALFSIVLGLFVDIILDLKYHLYGYFYPGVQFAGFLPALFLFPTTGVVFMNFYPFNKSLIRKCFYIFCWCVFCLIFEFLSLKSGYFYYNGWKYWYSALTYPFLFWLHLLHLSFFRHYTN